MRLIDLHVNWLLQYVGDSVVFDPRFYPVVADRLGQVDGYLQATRAAVVTCHRNADDWASQPDPWAALGHLLARIEAEFPGRLLIGPLDDHRWGEDHDGLSWALIGIEGFDALIRSERDLCRLSPLFERGVRLFQPVDNDASLLGGSSIPGDDRGLTGLGLAFLEALAALAPEVPGPRPLLDLARLNPRSASEALDWFEADPLRAARVVPVYSRGALAQGDFGAPGAISPGNLSRLRALGGVVGLGVSPPWFDTADQLKAAVHEIAAIPFQGRAGSEGIAIGTGFLGGNDTLPGLRQAAEVISWARSAFDRPTARALLHDNARDLIARAVGASLRR